MISLETVDAAIYASRLRGGLRHGVKVFLRLTRGLGACAQRARTFMGLLSAWAMGRWPQAQHEAWSSGVASRLMRMATSFSYRSLVESSNGVEERTAAVS